MKTIQRLLLLLALVALGPFVLAACGGGGDGGGDQGAGGDAAATTDAGAGGGGGDTQAGAEVFASAGCGGCHTLEAANSDAMTGPNLDELQPSEAQVREQVTNGGGGMPAFKDRLTEQEIADVAAYVAQNAGT